MKIIINICDNNNLVEVLENKLYMVALVHPLQFSQMI